MLYAPKNEDVCENIKQENSEYRVEKLRRRRRSAIEDVWALEVLYPSEGSGKKPSRWFSPPNGRVLEFEGGLCCVREVTSSRMWQRMSKKNWARAQKP